MDFRYVYLGNKNRKAVSLLSTHIAIRRNIISEVPNSHLQTVNQLRQSLFTIAWNQNLNQCRRCLILEPLSPIHIKHNGVSCCIGAKSPAAPGNSLAQLGFFTQTLREFESLSNPGDWASQYYWSTLEELSWSGWVKPQYHRGRRKLLLISFAEEIWSEINVW